MAKHTWGGFVLIDVLADGLWAYRLGQATVSMLFVLAGVALFGAGMYRRRAFNRWNSSDDDRLLQPALQHDDDPDEEFDPRLRDDYDPEFDIPEDEDPKPTPRQAQPPGKGTVLIVIGVVVLLLGTQQMISDVALPRPPQAASDVEIGECITSQAYDRGHMNSEPVDCAQSDATMELASDGDATASCPDGKRAGTKYPALTNAGRTQCFILNLRENHCYAVARTATAVTCTSPSANMRVARRIEGTNKATGCPAEARMMAYPEPPRVYCIVAP